MNHWMIIVSKSWNSKARMKPCHLMMNWNIVSDHSDEIRCYRGDSGSVRHGNQKHFNATDCLLPMSLRGRLIGMEFDGIYEPERIVSDQNEGRLGQSRGALGEYLAKTRNPPDSCHEGGLKQSAPASLQTILS